ncbi:MAG: sirohydrochlorin chelatase [Burkholderiales bacterium]
MKPALVLFAHGSRDPQWSRPFEALREALAGRFDVELAYLELMAPGLEEAVARLAARGAKRVRVVPVFLGQGAHLARDLPALAAAAGARHPGIALELEPPVGEQPAVIAALAAAISRG